MARRDFPYYRGAPVALSATGWVLALGGCVAGFLALILVPRGPLGGLPGLVAPLLFVILPLAGLALGAGRGWMALFPRPRLLDILIGVAFAPLVLAVSGLVAFVFSRLGPAVSNPAAVIVAQLEGMRRLVFIGGTAPQLLGEELVTLVPFLALLTLLHGRLGLSKHRAIAGAWILSAAIFGLLHLPTYGWNLLQVLLVIGAARLVLTIPYLLTKSVWSSFAAHLTLDWSIFALVLLGSARA